MAADRYALAHGAAHEAATSPWNARKHPSEAQKRAGNYKLGQAYWQGLGIKIENPAHTVREGVDPDGKPWRCMTAAHYGYFAGTKGADGDGVDVFLGPAPESTQAWIINQRDAAGAFDEHKCLVGFADADHAREAYVRSYSPGWNRGSAPIPLSLTQLRWWLKFADKRRPFTPELVPPENDMQDPTSFLDSTSMPSVFWDDATCQPGAGQTLAKLIYDLRREDGTRGLLLDAMTMDDIREGATVLALDGLVVLAGKLKPKMEALLRIMEAAGGTLKPLAVQFSDPIKRLGTVQVAVLYELSDGQTITAWFHNPDTTPGKFGPMDSLVSWKWQLNKKDVTISVAAERGQDLNIREVARRLMRLAEKNSAAFQRANAKRAETMAEIDSLRTTLAERQGVLKRLSGEIEAARIDREDRAARGSSPVWERDDFTATTPENYAILRQAGEAALNYRQDELDHFFGGRMIDVRNALRERGWDGERFKPLSKNGQTLVMNAEHTGAGANVVGVTWSVGDNSLTDDLTMTADELAAQIDSWLVPAAAPEPVAEVAPEPAAVEPGVAHEPEDKAPATVAPKADGDDAGPVVALTGNEFGEFADDKGGVNALRKVAIADLTQKIGQWFDCPALGGKVEVRLSGANKVKSLSGDPRKLKALAGLKEIIAGAKRVGTKPPYAAEAEQNVVAYHTLRSTISLAGEMLAVRTTVKEDDKGAFHWDHRIYAADAIFDGVKANGPSEDGPPTDTNYKPRAPADATLVAGDRPYLPPQSGETNQATGSILDDAGPQVNTGYVLNLFIEGESDADAVEFDAEDEAPPVEVYAFPDATDEARGLFAIGAQKGGTGAYSTAVEIDKAAAGMGMSVHWEAVSALPVMDAAADDEAEAKPDDKPADDEAKPEAEADEPAEKAEPKAEEADETDAEKKAEPEEKAEASEDDKPEPDADDEGGKPDGDADDAEEKPADEDKPEPEAKADEGDGDKDEEPKGDDKKLDSATLDSAHWSTFTRTANAARTIMKEAQVSAANRERIEKLIKEGQDKYKARIKAGRADEELDFTTEVSEIKRILKLDGVAVLDDAARNALEIALDILKTNEPINRAAGNNDQADLEARSAAEIERALGRLGTSLDDATGGLFGDGDAGYIRGTLSRNGVALATVSLREDGMVAFAVGQAVADHLLPQDLTDLKESVEEGAWTDGWMSGLRDLAMATEDIQAAAPAVVPEPVAPAPTTAAPTKQPKVKVGEARDAYDSLGYAKNDLSGHTPTESMRPGATDRLQRAIDAVKALIARGWPKGAPDPSSLIESSEQMIARIKAKADIGGPDTIGRGDLMSFYLRDSGLTEAQQQAIIDNPTSVETSGNFQVPQYSVADVKAAIAAAQAENARGGAANDPAPEATAEAAAPVARDEYPLGRTTKEDRFFGTRVRVLPELKGDTAWEGTIQMTMNGGRLFSVKRDGSDAGSIRIPGDRLEILQVVDSESPAEQGPAPAAPVAQANGRPDPGKYAGEGARGRYKDGQMAMANRGAALATLKAVNDKMREADASLAYSDAEIDGAVNIEAMRDWLLAELRKVTPAATAPDTARTEATAMLQTVVAGTHPDMLEPELLDTILSVMDAYPDDAELQALAGQAIDAVTNGGLAVTA